MERNSTGADAARSRAARVPGAGRRGPREGARGGGLAGRNVPQLTMPRVRRLRRADLDAVVRIDAFHTGEAKPGYWTRMLRAFVGSRPGGGHVGLAAELGGRVVGFILGDVRAFEFGSEPCGWILEVGVDPDVARRGVATALLGEACRRLRAAGVTTIRTMVTRNDVPVLTFFRTSGFAAGPYVQLELHADHDVPAETGAPKGKEGS